MKHIAMIMWVAGAALVALGGCQMGSVMQVSKNQPADRVNETPLVIDEAMQVRTWEPSTARYANGDTISHPTLFRYEPAWDQPEWRYAVIETPLFVMQVIGMPIMMVKTPPFSDVRYTGVTTEVTYNAMPPAPTTPNVVTEAPVSEATPTEAPPTETSPGPAVEPATQP